MEILNENQLNIYAGELGNMTSEGEVIEKLNNIGDNHKCTNADEKHKLISQIIDQLYSDLNFLKAQSETEQGIIAQQEKVIEICKKYCEFLKETNEEELISINDYPFLNGDGEYKIYFVYNKIINDLESLERKSPGNGDGIFIKFLNYVQEELTNNKRLNGAMKMKHLDDILNQIKPMRVRFAEDFRIGFFTSSNVRAIFGVFIKNGNDIDYEQYDGIKGLNGELEETIINEVNEFANTKTIGENHEKVIKYIKERIAKINSQYRDKQAQEEPQNLQKEPIIEILSLEDTVETQVEPIMSETDELSKISDNENKKSQKQRINDNNQDQFYYKLIKQIYDQNKQIIDLNINEYVAGIKKDIEIWIGKKQQDLQSGLLAEDEIQLFQSLGLDSYVTEEEQKTEKKFKDEEKLSQEEITEKKEDIDETVNAEKAIIIEEENLPTMDEIAKELEIETIDQQGEEEPKEIESSIEESSIKEKLARAVLDDNKINNNEFAQRLQKMSIAVKMLNLLSEKQVEEIMIKVDKILSQTNTKTFPQDIKLLNELLLKEAVTGNESPNMLRNKLTTIKMISILNEDEVENVIVEMQKVIQNFYQNGQSYS